MKTFSTLIAVIAVLLVVILFLRVSGWFDFTDLAPDSEVEEEFEEANTALTHSIRILEESNNAVSHSITILE